MKDIVRPQPQLHWASDRLPDPNQEKNAIVSFHDMYPHHLVALKLHTVLDCWVYLQLGIAEESSE